VRVELAPEVFQVPDALTDLLRLLRYFADGRHDWVADPVVIDLAHGYFVAQAPNIASVCADLATKGTVAAQAWTASNEQTRIVRVEARTLSSYTEDLARPAVLVVEDQESDGFFITTVAKVFGFDRVQTALSRHWLEIRHGGGSGGVAKVAMAEVSRFSLCIRVAALLDSDRFVPGDRTRSHDKADQLSAAGVLVQVLELREAENYVPNRVLAGCGKPREADKKLSALKRLTPDQRGHFDMKKGFAVGGTVRAEQTGLYQGLDTRDLVALRGGFGTDLLRRLDEMSTHLTEHDFDSIGPRVVQELRALLGKIASVI
jgi:hypothetical protein